MTQHYDGYSRLAKWLAVPTRCRGPDFAPNSAAMHHPRCKGPDFAQAELEAWVQTLEVGGTITIEDKG